MANQITDNRTLVDVANAATNYVDISGAAAGTADTEILIQGTASIGQYLASTLDGLLYNAGSAQNWANNTFYIWINCGIVGLLDTKANGGFRIRFTGATVTDWFEVYVAGSDDWPPAIAGGWTQFVVDIETARSTAVTNGWTNGTTPATSAIQRVGWAGVTGGTMPRMVDNTWMDEIRRLPDGSPGIIVEGRNGGTTDWDSADIYAQLGDATGTFVPSAGGAWKINTPIQFGINDTSTHAFTDTNAVWLWDDAEFLPDDVYAISALGDSTASGGTTNVTFGTKTGTGNAATGAQGLTIAAASTGARWSMDVDNAFLTSVGLYGCSFIHGGTFELDQSSTDLASTLFIDCVGANVSNASIVRASVIQPQNGDGVAFMVTDDFGDIANSSFEFVDGHAIEITSTTTNPQNNVGNTFDSSFVNSVNSTDAAILHSSAGSLTINSSGGSNLQTNSYRNTGGGSVTINNNISVTLTGLVNPTEVRVYTNGTTTELDGQENVTTGSFTFSLAASTVVDIRIFAVSYEPADILSFTIPASDTSIPVQQRFDRNYSNP